MTSPAIDSALVRSLLAEQHPDLAELPVVHLADGWDNRIFRLGRNLTVRLPRRPEAAQLMAHEHRWLPALAAALPAGPDDLPASAPLRLGLPGCGYPWRWSVGPLLPGRPATVAPLADPRDAAVRLGRFLAAFHVAAPPDAPPNPVRGGPLSTRAPLLQAQLDAAARRGRSLGAGVERARVETRFAAALDVPAWSGPPLWLHGDPHPANLLVHEGRLSGVIDFGDLTSGDPATDLFVAWQLLPASAREAFREAAGGGRHPVDDAMWARGEGWAIAHCVAILAGSPDDAAPLVRIAQRTLAELS